MNDERDEHDPPKLTDIEQAIEDCTAAVVTELDDGKHDELRASIRVLVDFAKQSRKTSRHLANDCGCASCWPVVNSSVNAASCAISGRPTPEKLQEARRNVRALLERMRWMGGHEDIHVLVDATEEPTDKEIADRMAKQSGNDNEEGRAYALKVVQSAHCAGRDLVRSFFGKAERQ